MLKSIKALVPLENYWSVISKRYALIHIPSFSLIGCVLREELSGNETIYRWTDRHSIIRPFTTNKHVKINHKTRWVRYPLTIIHIYFITCSALFIFILLLVNNIMTFITEWHSDVRVREFLINNLLVCSLYLGFRMILQWSRPSSK